MPYTVLIFETRNPEISLEDFQNHYDNIHIPLLKERTGSAFPLTHTRYYLKRGSNATETSSTKIYPPLMFYGNPEEVDYDCVAFMIFEDYAAFLRFGEAYETSPGKAEMDAEEAQFIIKSKMKAIGTQDAHVTTR